MNNTTVGSSDSTNSNGTAQPANSTESPPTKVSPQNVFKRPNNVVPFDSPGSKRTKLTEESRPLREIHSVIMTTLGFISPAREGKLPEARTPLQARSDSPPPSSYPMVPPELKTEKKPKKVVKKMGEGRKLDKENKKKKGVKELFKPDKMVEVKVKKSSSKEAKTKMPKVDGELAAGPSSQPPAPKVAPSKATGSPKTPKASQKVKIDKPMDADVGLSHSTFKEEVVDKLPFEPDKQKLNIFKKISKPREDKEKDIVVEHKFKDSELREKSPIMTIDAHIDRLNRNDVVVKKEDNRFIPHTLDVVKPHPNDEIPKFLGHNSFNLPLPLAPPIPNMPKMPNMPELSIFPVHDQRKRKKERSSKKKEPKMPKDLANPKKAS